LAGSKGVVGRKKERGWQEGSEWSAGRKGELAGRKGEVGRKEGRGWQEGREKSAGRKGVVGRCWNPCGLLGYQVDGLFGLNTPHAKK